MARVPKPPNPRIRDNDAAGRSDRELLTRIGRSAGGRAGYKQLIREMGLGGGRERRLLLEQLASLVARGALISIAGEMWSLPRPEPAASSPWKPEPRSTPSRRAGGHWDGLQAAALSGRDRPGRDRLVAGRLDLHRDGFGFVRPEPGGPPRAGASRDASRGNQDIFIPPNEINGAMQGDMVLVDEAPPGRDGRRSGRIARVLTRQNPTVVGIFHYARARGRKQLQHQPSWQVAGGGGLVQAVGNFVTPLDERIGGAIAIAEGDENIPSSTDSPHRMLGEEARAQAKRERQFSSSRPAGSDSVEQVNDLASNRNQTGNTDPNLPLEGLAVDVEITSFPSPGRPARGRVIEVLGPPDGFGVDVEIIIRKHHIPHQFPAAVLVEASERAEETVSRLHAEEMTRREDFRGFPIVTIDGETARDFDDAVLVRDLPNGNSELQVHIADVSWYVRAASALDTEARVRGTSVYFPDRAVPMLPHALSSGMCSLLPNEDRLVLSCIMEIDPRGEVVRYRVAEGVIRSVRRMTYTSVQHCIDAAKSAAVNATSARFARGETWLEQTEAAPEPTAEDLAERERVGLEQPELPAAIDRMLELALRLNAKRVRRGSIDFDLPEPVVEFDPDGNMKAIVRSERGWAHRLIEEFMLSANECVATWLEGLGIASIYRIHEMPDPKRIVDFEETAAGFGQSLGLGNLPVRRFTMKSDRRDSRQRSSRGREGRAPQQHEIPESIPVTPQMYQKLIRRISGTPEERILSYLMLRSLKQARYAEKNEGHFALASPHYTHFTSPIRRYPDLIVHRLVRAMLRGGADAHGGAIRSDDPQPWSGAVERARGGQSPVQRSGFPSHPSKNVRSPGTAAAGVTERKSADGPIAAEELNDISVESSQAERRAADAERELIEWKKMKFMEDRVGDDFSAIILSVTKYGFFVELDELFIEGLVPIASLVGDHYSFRDTDRTICGARTGHCFAIGQRVHVLLDRIDRQQRRLQFALLPGTEPKASSSAGSLRGGKSEAKKAKAKVSGKAKARQRKKKR
jgi:ribonuclease R